MRGVHTGGKLRPTTYLRVKGKFFSQIINILTVFDRAWCLFKPKLYFIIDYDNLKNNQIFFECSSSSCICVGGPVSMCECVWASGCHDKRGVWAMRANWLPFDARSVPFRSVPLASLWIWEQASILAPPWYPCHPWHPCHPFAAPCKSPIHLPFASCELWAANWKLLGLSLGLRCWWRSFTGFEAGWEWGRIEDEGCEGVC